MPGVGHWDLRSDLWIYGHEAVNLRLHQITGIGDIIKNDGVIAYLSAIGEKSIAFYDAQLDALVKVPRPDRANSWTVAQQFSPATVTAPFVLNANAQGQLVTGLNADLLDGYHASAAATANTISIRDAAGRMKAAAPVADDDVATRQFVIDTAYGIVGARIECRVRATANVNVSSAPATNAAVWDGETLSNGDRVFLDEQTTQSQNGIWIYNGAGVAMTRATDADTDDEINTGMTVFVSSGTLWGGSRWQLITPEPITVGTTALDFAQIGGASEILPGPGIGINGNEIYVKLGTGGSPAGYTYTIGSLVWCSGAGALGQTGALSGILKSNGASGPAIVGGLTSTRLPKFTSTDPYLVNSIIGDDGTTASVLGGLNVTGNADVDGNLTAGNTTNASGAQFFIGATAARYLRLANGEGLTLRYDDTGSGTLKLENRDVTSAINTGFQINVNLSDNNSTNAIPAAKMLFAKQNLWTTTGTTQDAYFALQLAVNGSLAEVMRVLSDGRVGVNVAAPAAGLQGVDGAGTILWCGPSLADATAKSLRIGVPHHFLATNPNPFYGITILSDVSNNQVTIGGGTGLGVMATIINFVTHTDGVTAGPGTAHWQITNQGTLQAPTAKTIRTVTGDLYLQTGGGSGKVEVTTHSAGYFHITGAVATQPRVTFTDATSYGRWDFYESSTYIGAFQVIGSAFVDAARRNSIEMVNKLAGEISFWTNNTKRWVIGSTGNLSSPGASTILTQTGSLTLQTGNGDGDIIFFPHGTGRIIFPGTMNGALQATAGVVTAGTLPITAGGTGQITKATAFNALSPTTTLGDIIYGGASGAGTRLAGNTTTTAMFLRSTGSAGLATAPVWAAITAADLPGGFSGFATPAALTVGIGAPSAGVATTAIRSDATLQLSQSIAPTWTAKHIFNLEVRLIAQTANRLLYTDSNKDTASVTAGTDNRLAKWSGGIIGNSILADDGSNVSVVQGTFRVDAPYGAANVDSLSIENNGTPGSSSSLVVRHQVGSPWVMLYNFRGQSGGGISFGNASAAVVNFEFSSAGVAKFRQLTTNGLLQTSGGDGTIGVSNDLPAAATHGGRTISHYYSQNLAGTGPTWSVTHGLNNLRPIAMLRDTTTGNLGVTHFDTIDNNTLEVVIQGTISAGQFDIICIG